nr:RNA-directed DNA polymerase, eukaryota [Tanacetum cinerariifolium]
MSVSIGRAMEMEDWDQSICNDSYESNSGGILCIWEPTLFVKDDVRSSNNFLAIMGTLDGDCVIMRDFKEVRTGKERYGLVFNAQGANAFNSFISLASLIDLSLDGYAYTWAYKTANKMSKLDKFLVSKGLLASISYLSALCLDRNLLNHRPILMRKCSQLAIRGTLVDDEWIVDPLDVKSVFLRYFSTQFSSPVSPRIFFANQFTNRLSLEQQADLERNVSNEEIKSVVWDCGMNKSPGPDDFTFEFFRRYWKLLEHDIIATVKDFLLQFGWINGHLNSAMRWVLVNGSPTSEFQFHKGFKLRDPLSPFLFILIIESLHLSFSKITNAGLFLGIPIDSSLTLSHIFFTDYDIFVGKWKSLNLRTIVNVLKCFHLASGLKINFHRSKLKGVDTRPEEVDVAATTKGCSILTTLFIHFGVKVGGAMSRIRSWDDMVAKVSSHLSKWKLKTPSIGGRVTLIKSCHTSKSGPIRISN